MSLPFRSLTIPTTSKHVGTVKVEKLCQWGSGGRSREQKVGLRERIGVCGKGNRSFGGQRKYFGFPLDYDRFKRKKTKFQELHNGLDTRRVAP